MNRSTLITIFAFLFFIFIYFFISNSLKNRDNFLNKITRPTYNKIKNSIPNSTKKFLKETIFVYENQRRLKKEIEENYQARLQRDKTKLLKMLEIYDHMAPLNFFKKGETNHSLGNTNLLAKKYTQPILKYLGPRTYFEYYNQNLFLINGTGNLMVTTLNQLKQNQFVFKKIDTNLLNVIGREYINNSREVIKHLLIVNDIIYISYVEKKENCYLNSILSSNLNLKKMEFKKFFSTNECQPSFTNQSGGRLSKYKNQQILFTIGDHKSSELREDLPQDMNSLVGKIIKINTENSQHKIVSVGHRNNQGIDYDENEDVIYLTEHGPQGGDEININVSADAEIKNYGWAVSSYGEHYGFPAKTDVLKEMYKRAPLNKSHIEYGYVEPIKYYTPAIAPTQIIKTEKFIKNDNKKTIYFSSLLGGTVYQLILNSDFSVHKENTISFKPERIRDMIYIEEIDKILLFLETTGSIVTLEKLN